MRTNVRFMFISTYILFIFILKSYQQFTLLYVNNHLLCGIF
jgi:hypothetical protein